MCEHTTYDDVLAPQFFASVKENGELCLGYFPNGYVSSGTENVVEIADTFFLRTSFLETGSNVCRQVLPKIVEVSGFQCDANTIVYVELKPVNANAAFSKADHLLMSPERLFATYTKFSPDNATPN